MLKLKVIRESGGIFLIRLSFSFRDGSIKLHLILDDDLGPDHKHPWDFKSFLLFGSYKELLEGKLLCHKPFTFVSRKAQQRHKVILYRFLGVKLPCLTIGKYSKKYTRWCERKKLCDGCCKLGYCKDRE
ncbi:MAG: hypothetical protein CMK64_11585 [Pseudoalteromonas sp.]|nr:hypothetical protein [Pseudoalteromonas sp.]